MELDLVQDTSVTSLLGSSLLLVINKPMVIQWP